LGNTTIADSTVLTTLKFSGDNSIQSTGFTDSKNTALSNATSDISQIQSDLSNVQSDLSSANINISLKQDIIDNSNKLVISNVDLFGSVLAHIDISSSLQTQITGLTALQDEDTAQTTLNNSLTSDITSLQTEKQNVIDGNNKVSSLYVSYNVTTVMDEFDASESYNAANSNNL